MSSDRLEVHESGQEDGSSVFEERTLDNIHLEIQETYLADDRPWVIRYSGGKDSTTALQLIWYAIKDIPEKSARIRYMSSHVINLLKHQK